MRSPHWCLEPGAAQGALETVQEIWLEIGAKEPGLPLLRSYDQHLDLNWSPECTRVFAMVSADHSLASTEVPFGSSFFIFRKAFIPAKIWLPHIELFATQACWDNMNAFRDIVYQLDYQIIHLKFSEVIV